MALEIQRDRIGMAVIWSALTEEDLDVLPDIPIESRRIPESCVEELSAHVYDNGIQGFLVNWPTVPESGGLGAQCGRVLYTLESILAQQQNMPCQSRILSSKRPICFWEPSAAPQTPTLGEPTITSCGVVGVDRGDVWGRCSSYANTSNKTRHLASIEQYAFDETREAEHIWEDFWRAHWPEQYQRNQRRKVLQKNSANSTCGNNLISDWRDAPAYLSAGLAM